MAVTVKPRHALLLIPLVALCVVWRNIPREPPPLARDQALPELPPHEPPPDKFAIVAVRGTTRVAWIDREYLDDVPALKGAAMAIDDHDGRFSLVVFFTDRKRAPRSWPESEEYPLGEALRYWHNPVNGESQLSWPDGRRVEWIQER